jgi:hypothetical protein
MDLDGTAEAGPAIRATIHGMFEDGAFTRRLRTFRIRELDPGEGPNKDTETTFLAKEMATGRLKEAHARALAISYAEYEGQVFEFLGDEARRRYATERAWDEMRLGAAALIESVLKLQERK